MIPKPPTLFKNISVNGEANTTAWMDESPTINSTFAVKINSNPLLMNKGNVSPKDFIDFKEDLKELEARIGSDRLPRQREIKKIDIKDLDCFSSLDKDQVSPNDKEIL
jgi:hypothetical protein